MRVLVDAMSASHGGIATYVDNLLTTWPGLYPEDELHVLTARDAARELPSAVRVHELAVPRPTVVGRPVAQTRHLPALVRQTGAHAVLATLPSTTLRHPGVPLVVVVHDLRHELRPEQFSRARRALRAVSYGRAYAMADAFVSVSQRTLDDLHAQRPRTRSAPATVVHHGTDHALEWPPPAAPGDYAVAHGHHSNKNVELVIDAWALLAMNGTAAPRLRILGLPAERRAVLAATLRERGLDRLVELSPFLPEAQFRAVMAGARLLVFPSDFEGFGLPVLEAMLLGIPVVVGPDPGVLEIAGGHARVLSGWSPTALADAVDAALATDAAALDEAHRHAATFTWKRAVAQTRAAVATAVYAPD